MFCHSPLLAVSFRISLRIESFVNGVVGLDFTAACAGTFGEGVAVGCGAVSSTILLDLELTNTSSNFFSSDENL